jgi:hypothetical protein
VDLEREGPQLEVHVSEDGLRLAARGSRYEAFVEMLLESPGELSSETRRAIMERDTKAIPPSWMPYVLKVALHAYRIEDDDIAGLKRDGRGEDEIFEATVSAAVGAALMRLDQGMAALRASAPEAG